MLTSQSLNDSRERVKKRMYTPGTDEYHCSSQPLNGMDRCAGWWGIGGSVNEGIHLTPPFSVSNCSTPHTCLEVTVKVLAR